jgi:DNA polymerase bacteriophage-type
MKLWLDTETFSEVPLRDGTHAYAERAEVMLLTWAVDEGPVHCWDRTEFNGLPGELHDAVLKAETFWWQNGGMFDRPVLKHAMPALYSVMPEHKWRDTMVQAYAHGLPGSMGALSEIFKLGDAGKDKRGKQLIQLFCKPRPANSKVSRYTRLTHPAEWAEFKEYAKQDIVSMRALHAKIPKWNYPNNTEELNLWFLDQRMNMGGLYVDVDLAEKAIEAVAAEQASLAERTHEATDGVVCSATQRDALLNHILAEHGVSLPDMRSDTLERRLNDVELPAPVRELISIRLMASTSSTSKYKRLVRGVGSDGYLRGLTQFCGAARTGRDAHRLFQPGNMMRPTLPQSDIEIGIDSIKAGCADLVTENVMELCANTMRSVIIAPPGQKIVVSDLANIEGRVAAWVAGEAWKLQAFRDYDAGTGPDLYVKAYSEAFRVALDAVDKKLRQIGKVMELMLAYGGGVGAFLTGAATYGINLDDLAASGRDAIPPHIWADAENFWNWCVETKRNTYGLAHDTFCVCDSIKRLWRLSNPAISGVWGVLESAAQLAIDNPGEEFRAGQWLTFDRKGNWLRIKLPSGRYLNYPSPQAGDSITYLGQNQYTRKFERLKTYGGKLLENVCQAIARDVLFYHLPALAEARYDVRLRVHDEVLAYAPDGLMYGAKHLSKLISAPHAWAPGLPLAAAGFEGYRYRKD